MTGKETRSLGSKSSCSYKSSSLDFMNMGLCAKWSASSQAQGFFDTKDYNCDLMHWCDLAVTPAVELEEAQHCR